MKNNTLKLVIKQIRKYKLTKLFEGKEPKQFEKWISMLNSKQINNFLSLNIDINEINFPIEILLDNDLLNYDDYTRRIEALINFKNYGDCYIHSFLKSSNFYKDIEVVLNNNIRDGLWILGTKSFINSPYHDEDLNLLIKTQSANNDIFNSKISDALARVAADYHSIKSRYHQLDMKLIAQCKDDYSLQTNKENYIKILSNLAINEVSLSDKYHLENMQILASNPVSKQFLFKIMTDVKTINGKYYRKEIEALVKAKSEHTAEALYYYIKNPGYNFGDSHYYDIEDAPYVYNCNYVSGRNNPDYLKNLELINQINDKFVIRFVSILMNQDFINSNYKKFDLELLESISSESTFIDLYRLMFDSKFLNSIHHKEDIIIISQTANKRIRQLLLKKATDEHSICSINHKYDMNYISKLDIDNISNEIYRSIYYYLFDEKGINNEDHISILEKLSKGIPVDVNDCFSEYLNNLEKQIDDNENNTIEIIKSNSNAENKLKILTFIKKIIHKG
ncbi:MAG: hypothetical protein NC181_02800 [Clostridium sp.]|nr:hypothetical protein [Clostridium sp.]MCM1444109.1 hypothetical protein [Candidatus Amulumruptor caecigallinarius]